MSSHVSMFLSSKIIYLHNVFLIMNCKSIIFFLKLLFSLCSAWLRSSGNLLSSLMSGCGWLCTICLRTCATSSLSVRLVSDTFLFIKWGVSKQYETKVQLYCSFSVKKILSDPQAANIIKSSLSGETKFLLEIMCTFSFAVFSYTNSSLLPQVQWHIFVEVVIKKRQFHDVKGNVVGIVWVGIFPVTLSVFRPEPKKTEKDWVGLCAWGGVRNKCH